MSECTDQKPAETAAAPKADELAALPLAEAPSIEPAMKPVEDPVAAKPETPASATEAVADKPSDTPSESKPAEAKAAAEDKPTDTKLAEADAKSLASWIARTPASKRFRESASDQIAAARERIAQRNLSGAMTVALAVGVLSAGVAGGGGYLAGLSERSTTHAMALEQSVLRIEAEMALLRGEMERASRTATASADETGERLERIEKAQAEPLAKLGRLAEMVEKLRSAQEARLAAAKADPGDITGSVNPRPGAKPRSASPAVVEAWVLREFDKDVALIEGKRGLLEIAVGDDIPGVGRVEGFRKHDGQWAVVTSKGLITAR